MTSFEVGGVYVREGCRRGFRIIVVLAVLSHDDDIVILNENGFVLRGSIDAKLRRRIS